MVVGRYGSSARIAVGPGAMFLDSDRETELVYSYTQYYSLYKVLKPDIRNALIIGGGALTVPKAMLAELPGADIYVAEIEGKLFDIAREYFRAPVIPRLKEVTADGRRFLAQSTTQFDFIFSDAFYTMLSIPSHLTTREFFELALARLVDGGLIIVNLNGSLADVPRSFTLAEMRTFQTVFENSVFFGVRRRRGDAIQNVVMVGRKGAARIDVAELAASIQSDSLIRSLPMHRIDTATLNLGAHDVLIDDYSPVEFLTSRELLRYMR